jgi:hypothetical protein
MRRAFRTKGSKWPVEETRYTCLEVAVRIQLWGALVWLSFLWVHSCALNHLWRVFGR